MADNISQLDPNTPTGTQVAGGGDEELQGIKLALTNDFGGIAGPVFQDANTSGAGGSTPVTDVTMSSWEARIAALEASFPGIAIAGFTLDGGANTIGPYFGIEEDSPGVGTTQRVAAGQYEVKLSSTRWSDANLDLVGVVTGISSFTVLLGNVVPPTVNNQAEGWVQVITILSDDLFTPVDSSPRVVIFDKGRV